MRSNRFLPSSRIGTVAFSVSEDRNINNEQLRDRERKPRLSARQPILLSFNCPSRAPLGWPTASFSIKMRNGKICRTSNHKKLLARFPHNVLTWLEDECPFDILPKILAYTGPQMALILNRTNRFWHDALQQESLWRVMCEDLYKWKDGDEPPRSWKELYRLCPCVPTDYSSITAALNLANTSSLRESHSRDVSEEEQGISIRILLRPGNYFITDSIVIHTKGINTPITIESMQVPIISRPITSHDSFPEPEITSLPKSPKERILHKAKSFRNFLSCRSEPLLEEEPDSVDVESIPTATRASLISRSRRSNQPLIRVQQGKLCLRKLNVIHNTAGIDIWNGNAAIQIQPRLNLDETFSMPTDLKPCAVLDQVDICSISGRGIVAIDGGSVFMTHSYIHDCAATGVYVGGAGSQATLNFTDVIRNGNGNGTSRRGVQRGHSGIYLEQGHAVIRDCNISQNSLTGISAVSQENAILELSESDLVANGAQQLEMPPFGSSSRRQSVARDNRLANSGGYRSRSGLLGFD